MNEQALIIIAPLFSIMLLGYALGRIFPALRRWVGPLNRFVFDVAMPALLFTLVANVSPDTAFDLGYAATLTISLVVMFAAPYLIVRFTGGSQGHAAIHGLCANFSATGYLGLPLLLWLYGDAASGPAVFGALVTLIAFIPLGIALTKGGGAGPAILGALRTPAVASTALGMACLWLKWAPPDPVMTALGALGAVFIPGALLVTGLHFSGVRLGGDAKVVGALSAAKLLVHPLVAWALGAWVFGLEGFLLSVVVLQAALPTGVPIFALARRAGVLDDLAASVIVVTTFTSLGTLLGVLALFA